MTYISGDCRGRYRTRGERVGERFLGNARQCANAGTIAIINCSFYKRYTATDAVQHVIGNFQIIAFQSVLVQRCK